MRFRLLPDSPLGWTPYAWLIYLSLYVAYAFFLNRTPADWVISTAGLLVFLVLYFRAFWLRGNALVAIAFAIVAIGVVLSPVNPGASVFFIYGASFLGAAKRPAVAVRWLGVILSVVVLEAWLVPLPPQTWIPGVVFSLLIGGTNIHFGELRRKDAALLAARETARRMAALAERERIARDLHDLLGHTLSVIVLKSELASKLADRDPRRAASEIRDVEQISRNALQEVRRAIYGYRGESLAHEVEGARAALAAAGVTLTADLPHVDLSPDVERAVALAVREAVTNVIRHARATTCTIVTEPVSDGTVISIEDNGVGGHHQEGAGIAGMRARLGELGGTVTLNGSRGTRLVLKVPVPPAARATPEVVS